MERERKIEILKDLLIQLSDSANILCTCEADERCEVIEEYIKALEDKITITMDKGTLKCSNQGYVIYNKDWFRKHFATEVEIITGYDGYSKQPTSDDCVSRQAVLEKINDWWGITSTSGEPTLCDCIRELPPVTPTKSSSPAIPLDKVKQARRELDKLPIYGAKFTDEYRIHLDREEVFSIIDKLIAESEDKG